MVAPYYIPPDHLPHPAIYLGLKARSTRAEKAAYELVGQRANGAGLSAVDVAKRRWRVAWVARAAAMDALLAATPAETIPTPETLDR